MFCSAPRSQWLELLVKPRGGSAPERCLCFVCSLSFLRGPRPVSDCQSGRGAAAPDIKIVVLSLPLLLVPFSCFLSPPNLNHVLGKVCLVPGAPGALCQRSCLLCPRIIEALHLPLTDPGVSNPYFCCSESSYSHVKNWISGRGRRPGHSLPVIN